MSDKPTYMDCWHFIAPLIPVNTDYTMDIYIMVFNALKEAEKKRIAKREGIHAGQDQAENLLQFGVPESPRSESR